MNKLLNKMRLLQQENIEKEISELRMYLLKYDFKTVLSYLFIKENFEILNSDGYIKDDPIIITYVADMYLSNHAESKKEIPNEEVIKEIIEKVTTIYLTYMSILQMKETGNDLSRIVSADTLLVKRSFFINVFYRVNKDIINSCVPYFKDKFGFDLMNVIHFRTALTKSVFDAIKKSRDYKELTNALNIEECKLHDLMGIEKEEVNNIIRYYTISQTKNNQLLPRRENPLILKPIIYNENAHFCINPLSLIENLRHTVESELKKQDNEWNKYCTRRGKILENTVYNEFSSFFKHGRLYRNLKYRFVNTEELYETDLIIEVDQYLLIIESKSGTLSESAKSGSEDRLKNDINALVHNAHDQCKRTLKYLQSRAISRFFDGNKVIRFKKSDYEKIYLVSITLENLELITANVHTILELSDHISTVSLSVYDLSVMLEILRGPAEFLLYLDRREKSIQEGKIHAHDELDIFSTFLSTGLLFSTDEKYDTIDVTNFSDDIEKYYIFGSRKQKIPRFKVESIIINIISELEKENNPGNVAVSKELLSYSYSTQKTIANAVMKVCKNALLKGSSDFSIKLNESNTGITFFGSASYAEDIDLRRLTYYIKNKMMVTSIGKWFLVIIHDLKNLSNFELFRFNANDQ